MPKLNTFKDKLSTFSFMQGVEILTLWNVYHKILYKVPLLEVGKLPYLMAKTFITL
jgi:hypothetical protein